MAFYSSSTILGQSVTLPGPGTSTSVLPAAGCATSTDAFAGTGSFGASWTRQNDTSNATASRIAGAAVTGASPPLIEIPYYCNAVTLANDQWSEVVIDGSYITGSLYVGATVRAAGTTAGTFDYYAVNVTSTTWFLDEVVNGVSTTHLTGSVTVAHGDVIRISAIGSTISAYLNGALLGAKVDTTLTAGFAGFTLYGTGQTGFASWAAGEETDPGEGGIDYYVAPSGSGGSDSNAGTLGSPWLTLNYALAHVACGDTILVRAGSYAASINTQTTPATSCLSWALPVTMKAYPGEAVHLPSIAIAVEDYLIFEDLILDGIFGGQGETISIAGGQPAGTGAGHIRFVNCDIHGNNTTPAAPGGYAGANGGMLNSSIVSLSSGGTGFNEFIGGHVHDIAYPFPAYLIDGYNDGSHGRPGTPHCFYVESPNNLLDGVEINRCANYAIHNIYSNGSNNVYRNNFIHHTGTPNQTGFAVLLSTGSGNVAYNNIIVWNANGVDISEPGQKFYNNTVAFNGLSGSCGSGPYVACYPAVVVEATGTGIELKNNIIYGNYSDSIAKAFGSTTTETANPFTNPSFTNGGGSYLLASDFQIQSGSTAKDTGADLSGTFTTSYVVGVTRPQGAGYDIGAYESVP